MLLARVELHVDPVVVGAEQGAPPPQASPGGGRLDGHGAADRPLEMAGGAEPPLEAGAGDLEGVGARAGGLDGGVGVEDRQSAVSAGRRCRDRRRRGRRRRRGGSGLGAPPAARRRRGRVRPRQRRARPQPDRVHVGHRSTTPITKKRGLAATFAGDRRPHSPTGTREEDTTRFPDVRPVPTVWGWPPLPSSRFRPAIGWSGSPTPTRCSSPPGGRRSWTWSATTWRSGRGRCGASTSAPPS